jgi:hypothetical protein
MGIRQSVVADVDLEQTGLITANSIGKAVISATTENGKVAYCTVNVVRNQSIPRTSPRAPRAGWCPAPAGSMKAARFACGGHVLL